MSILDDLDQEIDHRKQAQQANQKQRDDVYREHIRPWMERAFGYFKPLAEKLNYLQRELPVNYYIARYGEIEGLMQSDYEVQVDDNMGTINLGFICQKNGVVTLDIQGKNAIQWQKDYFREHNLEFEENRKHPVKIPSSEFRLRCRIPVVLRFKANCEQSQIDFIAYNFEQLGKVQRAINPKTMGTEFLDQLGLAILRKASLPAGTDNTATRKHKTVPKKQETAKAENVVETTPFRPGATVFVQRSDGSMEKGWRVIAPNQSVPESVRNLVGEGMVLCSREEEEATNYKIYTVQELKEIQK